MVCSPLSVVANKEGKLRLVMNLRHLNQFLHKDCFILDHFKYEDLVRTCDYTAQMVLA